MSEPITAASDTAALVHEGNAALLAGDSYLARQRFREALDRDPQWVAAWIGLAGSVRPFREKREHLRRALEIDPTNAEARAVLAQVEARLAAGEVLAPGGVAVRDEPPASLAASMQTIPLAGPVVAEATPTTLYCYNHPERETGLRCTNCERPICAECVRPAVVGQLCPECAKIRRPVNYQVSGGQIALVAVVALIAGVVVTFLAAQLLLRIGFFSFILAFVLGPAAGDLLVRLLDRLTRAKRGRPMQLAVGISYALGASPWILLFTLFGALPLSLILFTIFAITTCVARTR